MNSLLNFYTFVKEISKENGSNYKKAILTKYKDDEDIKYYLNFLFNPYITTGISDKKLARPITITGDWSKFTGNNYIKDVLNYISEHNTGSDAVLAFYRFHTNDLDTPLKELLDKIVSKNLPLGILPKTINKIIPNLIPEFNVQLANKYFDKPSLVDGKEFTITTKLDGNRIIALKTNGVVKFYTRQGKEYDGLVDLEEELTKLDIDNICLDGELIADRKEGQDSKDQFTETQKLARTKDKNKHGLKMRVFDILESDEFMSQRSVVPYSVRRAQLEEFFEINKLTYFVKVPVLYSGSDTSKILELLTQEMNHGEEGVMININDAPYIFDRCNTLLKVKKMKDLDLEIIGFEEGTNRHAGRLGALLVNYDGYTVKVGSGFSDELRDEIWNNKEEWLGRTVIVQYFEETFNANEGKSLRFPVYIDYREDK